MSDINFSKLTWENLPARTTALSATNLNRIENGIADSVNGVNSNSHSIAELQGSNRSLKAILDEINGSYVPYKASSPIMIQPNTDINTLTTTGIYYVNTNSIANTLTNCPTNVTFRLNVYAIGTRDSGTYAYIVQEIMPYNSTTVYRRQCTTGSTADVWTFGKWETDLGVMSDTFGTNGWQDVENTYFTRDYGDGSSVGDCRVYKQGGLAIVKLDGRIIANPSGWQTIGNVEKSVAIIATNVLTNNGQVVRLRVTTSGALQMAYTGEVPATIGTSFFYPMQVT